MFIAQPGYRSGGARHSGEAFLTIEEREKAEWELLRSLGEYTLRYLPDTHEVVLLKNDEAVYSELLDK